MLKDYLLKGRQRCVMLVLLLLLAVVAFAVPAKPGLTRLLTLTDGTTVNATLVGDEYLHYWLGDDGNAYQDAGDGIYQSFDPQTKQKVADQRRSGANEQRARRLAPRKIGNVGGITGQKKGLIILVNFSDVTFQEANNKTLYERIANEEGFTYTVNSTYSFNGSMRDYFYAQSEGKFELTFDVVGPVTVSKSQAYYGENDPNNNNSDKHPAEMVIEALNLADSLVDYRDYIWAENGTTVDQVYVIYAGKGEADGGGANTIWPHEWNLYSANYYGDGEGQQTLDGVTINTYACGGELNGQYDTPTIAGIGTMCHEFSHCLGYPDFYDTDYSGGQGMGYWDLMCSGSYNSGGYQPAGYTSYERWVAGWKEPTELVYTQTISNMKALQTTGSDTYIIYNKGNANEYYLLENRQKTGWDSSLPGAGLLILHVDYNSSIWSQNKPNDDPDHQRMTWIPADNEYQYDITSSGRKSYTRAGMANDPFPYGSVNAFGKNTTPAATLYNKNSDNTYYLDSSVENITQNSDGTISFDFVGIDPYIYTNESLTFSTTIGTPQTQQLEVLSEGMTEDIALTLTDANNVFSLGTNTISKSLEEATVDVTFSPTAAGSYTGTITLTSAGAETVTVSLSATATLPVPATPADLTLSEVTSNSLTASWSAVANADSYEIDMVEGSSFEASAGGTVLESDFSDTTGWTLYGTGTYTSSPYIGSGSPSIKFDGTGDYAVSPEFSSGAKLQFWAYGNGGSGSTFAISGLVNDTWTDIETVTIAQGGATYEVNLPAGTSQVKFYFTKSVNCGLDDVVVYGLKSPESVESYPKSVGNVTSYTVTGLTSETQYAVRVRAVNDGGNSDWSASATATTTGTTPVDPAIAYYQNADGKQGAALKTAMCGIIYNRTELQYNNTDIWEAYKTTDVRSDGTIWDMYSNITAYDPVNDPHANSAEGSGFNREHSFPKSWFGGEVMPMYTDLHHLYPVDGNINTRRSNNPYGETNGEDYKSANDFSKLGTCTYPGYTGKVFEPADEYKGDFARTYFYMVTCYEEKLHDWYTNYSSTEVVNVIDGSTYPGLQTWQLEMLMKWAKNDPVSEKETARNNAVYAIQNNRNPFIDYPGLEEYIWGSMTTTAFSYDSYVQPVYKQDVTMSFSLTEATATLGMDFTEPTLTTTPDGLTVTYSSSEPSVATVDAATGEVTLVAGGTTTITATFAGDETYNSGSASYTLNVSNPSLAFGETLLYEGVTTYNGSDSSTALTTTSDYLNYKNWSSITRVYPGGNAHSNGGCLKFGSGSGAGSMTTGSISLNGGGTLTFYLKQYGSDTGKLSVTVTGATADVEKFTPASTWTLCTVNLTKATGNVTIKLETTSDRAYVDEITLTSNNKLILANDGNNAANIAAAVTSGSKFDVTLEDRNLYKDGNWNTLCLPFDVDMNAGDCPLHSHGLTVMTLDGTTSNFNNGTLTLNFTTVYDDDTYKGDLVAGTPYIIKWTGTNTTIENPVFYGVTIDNTVRDKVCDLDGGASIAFCGTYEKLTYDDADASILFLGEENKLYYPESGASIGAQRAYFKLEGITAKASAPGNGSGSPVRAFVLNFGDEANGISATLSDRGEMINDKWYTLDGRRLNGQPTTKGLYIHGGRKVLIK